MWEMEQICFRGVHPDMRAARLALAIAMFVYSCGPRAAAVPPPLVQSPAFATGLSDSVHEVAVEEICDDGTIAIEAPIADSVCEDPDRFWPGSCTVPIVITVRNCTGDAVQVSEIALAGDGWTMIQWTLEAGAGPAPGETWTFSRTTALPDGTYQIHVSADNGSPLQTDWVELVVTNTTLEKAEAACTACSGVFGAHGMMGIVGCLCGTADAGRPCDDGDDCEGECISTDTGFACSDHVTVFGCHSYLPPGWSALPHPAPVKIPYKCVD
jgi:hypothetical protein